MKKLVIFQANQTSMCKRMIHIRTKRGWRPETCLSPPVKIVLLIIPRRCFFCRSFLLFIFRVCHALLSVHFSLVVTCWEWADLLVLLCMVFCCVLTLFRVVTWVRCGT